MVSVTVIINTPSFNTDITNASVVNSTMNTAITTININTGISSININTAINELRIMNRSKAYLHRPAVPRHGVGKSFQSDSHRINRHIRTRAEKTGKERKRAETNGNTIGTSITTSPQFAVNLTS